MSENLQLQLLEEVRDDVKSLHTRVTQIETKLEILLPVGGKGKDLNTKIVAAVVAVVTAVAGAWGGSRMLEEGDGADAPQSQSSQTSTSTPRK